MPNQLFDLDVGEISFVDRAAVRDPEHATTPQRFLLWKAEKAADESEPNDDADDDPNQLAQAVDSAIDEALNQWESNPDQAKALIVAAATSADELLDALGVDDPDEQDEDTDDTAGNIQKEESMTPSEAIDALRKAKKEGELTEEQKSALVSLSKAEEQETQRDQILKDESVPKDVRRYLLQKEEEAERASQRVALLEKAEQDRVERDRIQKAEQFVDSLEYLNIEKSEYDDVALALAALRQLDAERAAKLEKALTQSNTALKQSAMFSEMGVSGPIRKAQSAMAEAEGRALELMKSEKGPKTKAAALDAIFGDDTDLFGRVRREEAGEA